MQILKRRSDAIYLTEMGAFIARRIIFPRYQSDPRPVYALYTEKDKLPLKVQVCINYLTDYFVDVAELFQGMRGRRKE